MRIAYRVFAASLIVGCCSLAAAQDKSAGQTFTIGEGKLDFTAPASWTKKQPASRIIEAEFTVPPAKADSTSGRLTAMGAGGSVEQNVDRCAGQFVGAGSAAVKPKRDKR